MSFLYETCGGTAFYRSDRISAVHGFSTRLGGVSKGYLSSLNLGTHRGDTPEHVRANYDILASAMGFSPERTVFTKQVHGSIVQQVTQADWGDGLLREVTDARDGLISDTPGTVLCCFSADCIPVLLYDPVKNAGAAVHAGWRGTAADIVGNAVRAMESAFGSQPAELTAAIGPGIGACCFETHEDVPDALRRTLGADADCCCFEKGGGKYLVDLKKANRLLLERAGLPAGQIDLCTACTACRTDLFWSHRMTGAERGTQAGILVIPETENR